jgi:PIN domain nuclease of toxin-antitoxin system
MNLLLDTHAFIWFFNGDKQLPNGVKNKIADLSNQCFISIASLWEIAIKQSLGKLELAADFKNIAGFIAENDISILPVTFEHLQVLLTLPLHHGDPFDRIIISQGIKEKFIITTRDDLFKNYSVAVIWQ